MMWAGTPISWMIPVTMVSMLFLSMGRRAEFRRLSPPRISSSRSTSALMSQGFSIRYRTPRFPTAAETYSDTKQDVARVTGRCSMAAMLFSTLIPSCLLSIRSSTRISGFSCWTLRIACSPSVAVPTI